MSGCWQKWRGLEEVTEVTAFWGEGIGWTSHMLELQELGGFVSKVGVLYVSHAGGIVHIRAPPHFCFINN